jgi:uncharacterized protein YxeA
MKAQLKTIVIGLMALLVIVFGAAAVVTSSPTVAQASPEVSPVENVLYTPPDTAQPLIEPVSSTFTIEQAAKLFLSGVTVFSLVAVALTIIITQLLTFRANRTIRQNEAYAAAYRSIREELEWQEKLILMQAAQPPQPPPPDRSTTKSKIIPLYANEGERAG